MRLDLEPRIVKTAVVGKQTFAYYEKYILFDLLRKMPHASQAMVAGSFALHCKMCSLGFKSTWRPEDVDVWFGPVDIKQIAEELSRVALQDFDLSTFLFQHSKFLHGGIQSSYVLDEDIRNRRDLCKSCRRRKKYDDPENSVEILDIVDIYFSLHDAKLLQKNVLKTYLHNKYDKKLKKTFEDTLGTSRSSATPEGCRFQKISLIKTINKSDDIFQRCSLCARPWDEPSPLKILNRFDLDIVAVGFKLTHPLRFIEVSEHTQLIQNKSMHLQRADRNWTRQKGRIDKYITRGFMLQADREEESA